MNIGGVIFGFLAALFAGLITGALDLTKILEFFQNLF